MLKTICNFNLSIFPTAATHREEPLNPLKSMSKRITTPQRTRTQRDTISDVQMRNARLD